jgi:hypothetical protein
MPVSEKPAKALDGRIHYRRIWLNRPGHHGGAYIIASVGLERGKDGVDINASFLLPARGGPSRHAHRVAGRIGDALGALARTWRVFNRQAGVHAG